MLEQARPINLINDMSEKMDHILGLMNERQNVRLMG